jgi:hypothetical protein
MTQTDLQRIKDFEYKFNEVSRVMAALDMALDEYADIKSYIGDLKEYMESGQWKADFEADERGEIPDDIERGVLSEDGLYDLLDEVDRILRRDTIGPSR